MAKQGSQKPATGICGRFRPSWVGVENLAPRCDSLGAVDPTIGFEDLLARIGEIDIEEFRRSLLIGVLHEPAWVDDLLSGRKDLAHTIVNAPETKRQMWFTCVGLFPFQTTAPLATALQRLVYDPVGFRNDAPVCLRLFWDRVFASTWEAVHPAFERSAQESRRLFEATMVTQFFERILMTLEANHERRILRAVRGGRGTLRHAGGHLHHPIHLQRHPSLDHL
ncbi:MAG: hypothetical protein CME13_04485 [Gemmatimonadetes bacterium]|jgi:hypothetical protein|nr:hypothetical protein [Gemmatimonadota bacterium]